MKAHYIRSILTATLLAAGAIWQAKAQTPPPAAIAPNTPAIGKGGAKIQFTELEHDFGKIDSGASVNFDFVFTNTGTATLEVTNVRPSCGCTTAGAWSKSVEPGRSGTIPIQFNSGNFSGPIHKTVTVTSNTPGQPLTILSIKASVFRAIDVNPPVAYFTPQAGAQAVESRVVRIVNNAAEPLVLSAPECANKIFTAELKTLNEGKEFELRISAKPPFAPGTIQAPITLKTSSKNLPLITINGIVMVQMPITAMPAQLVIGPTPLALATKLAVTLRNTGSSAVSVSEPTVNLPDVEATVQELQAGRVFNIMLDFPAGFEIKATEHAELIVKTSHPQHPVVRVPILRASQTFQPQRPMVPTRIAVTGAAAIPIPQPPSHSPPPPMGAKPVSP
jgi:hypothetical protein